MVHRVDITFFADLLKLAHVICVWNDSLGRGGACWYLIGHVVVVVVAVVVCCCILAGVLVFLYCRWQYMVVERSAVPPYLYKQRVHNVCDTACVMGLVDISAKNLKLAFQ
jgi:hypothetical protein